MATKRKFKFRKTALILLALALAVYTAVLAYLFLNQRSLLYALPPKGTPTSSPWPGIERVQIVTADGEHLVAWWRLPKADQPTFLFFGGQGGRLSDLAWREKRIETEGAGLLAVAYRGFDGSTGHPTERGLRQDALAAYGWLVQRVPASDIVIHGFSLGTGVAVRLAVEKPARALILEAPYTSTADVAVLRTRWVPVRLLMLDQFRSRDRIGKLKMPLLIVHGDRDSSIPFTQGQELFIGAPAKAVCADGGV